MRLCRSGEDYLKAIHILQRSRRSVHSVDVSEYLGVSRPSVSQAVKSLCKMGFLRMDVDHTLHLTSTGEEVSERLLERHRFFAAYLRNAGVDASTAEKEACRMEHVISEDSFQKLKVRGQTACLFKDICYPYAARTNNEEKADE